MTRHAIHLKNAENCILDGPKIQRIFRKSRQTADLKNVENYILDDHQDLKNLEVSRTKAGSPENPLDFWAQRTEGCFVLRKK